MFTFFQVPAHVYESDSGLGTWISGAAGLLYFIFWLWMLASAVRRGEYLWAVMIFFSSGLAAVFYFFMIYRQGGSGLTTGFELPGAWDRRQIKTLQAQIHHLDKPHHHLQLGDIYFQQGKLEQAETCYRAAYARDALDEDIRAHFGTCLARRGKLAEARPLLESVATVNPKHDYGYTLMTLAETQAAMGDREAALVTWRKVLAHFSYARARMQMAQLLIDKKDFAEAVRSLDEVITEAPYSPAFQRRKDAIWVHRAKALRRTVPVA